MSLPVFRLRDISVGTSRAFGAYPAVSNRAETCNIFFFNFDNLKSYKLYLSQMYLPDIRKQRISGDLFRVLLSRAVNPWVIHLRPYQRYPNGVGGSILFLWLFQKILFIFLKQLFFNFTWVMFLRYYAIGAGNSSPSPSICSSSQGSRSPSISALWVGLGQHFLRHDLESGLLFLTGLYPVFRPKKINF